MQVTQTSDPLANKVCGVLSDFADWLGAYGETSRDHQSFFAGPTGRAAKALYYRHKLLGTAAVAPIIFLEAFMPSARRLFHRRIRFPIADAHYAMGFAFLYQTSANAADLNKATHFLDQLEISRSAGYQEYCWGYPFDWVTRGGTIKAHTPFITTTPYAYEAFLQVYEIVQRMDRADEGIGSDLDRLPSVLRPLPSDSRPLPSNSLPLPSVIGPRSSHRGVGPYGPEAALRSLDRRDDWKRILQSIARHARFDIKDYKTSDNASSCSYSPLGEGGVINAAAYRAFLLTSASQVFGNEDYWKVAERNLNFVLENQNPDGSWFYAVDGVRHFVDHYHTCFVMKALAKIHTLTGDEACGKALERGVAYYSANLFDEHGLPKPFSKAPRLTVYKRELYDCAECINLCLLLRDRFPALEVTLETVVAGVLKDWVKPDGSFRSRRLHFGWDNVPMHRWGQAQMFRSLAFYLRESSEHHSGQRSEVSGQKQANRQQNADTVRQRFDRLSKGL